jgi:cytochrome c biogenesis protein CcdA
MAAFDGVPAAAAAFLATFAAGHALPLVLLGTTGSLVARRLAHRYDGGAAAVVSGTLLLALGAYYGMLA